VEDLLNAYLLAHLFKTWEIGQNYKYFFNKNIFYYCNFFFFLLSGDLVPYGFVQGVHMLLPALSKPSLVHPSNFSRLLVTLLGKEELICQQQMISQLAIEDAPTRKGIFGD